MMFHVERGWRGRWFPGPGIFGVATWAGYHLSPLFVLLDVQGKLPQHDRRPQGKRSQSSRRPNEPPPRRAAGGRFGGKSCEETANGGVGAEGDARSIEFAGSRPDCRGGFAGSHRCRAGLPGSGSPCAGAGTKKDAPIGFRPPAFNPRGAANGVDDHGPLREEKPRRRAPAEDAVPPDRRAAGAG